MVTALNTDIIRDMDIHMGKTIMASIRTASMDLPIRNMDITIPDFQINVLSFLLHLTK